MPNKVILFFAFVLFCSAALFARERGGGTRRLRQEQTGSNRTVKLTKDEKKDLKAAAAAFNPKQPLLTQEKVAEILLKKIYDPLIGKKFEKDLDKVKKPDDAMTNLSLQVILRTYDILAKNPELVEVTAFSPAWIKEYRTNLAGFEPLARRLDIARLRRNREDYAAAAEAFEVRQKAVKSFLDKKPPKISGEELKKIRRANAVWRTEQFKKYRRELLERAEEGAKTNKSPSR